MSRPTRARGECRDPAHHVAEPVAFLREVARLCAERGLRLTPLRLDVLRLVAESPRPATAYALLDQIRESKARSAPTTIYRSLDFLVAQGFVHKLESTSTFVACQHPRVPHTVPFLICDGCGNATELEDDAAGAALGREARKIGFVPSSQTLEVHGRCVECRGLGR